VLRNGVTGQKAEKMSSVKDWMGFRCFMFRKPDK